MAMRKEDIRPGMRLTAEGGPAEINDRRDRIRKGQFMTVDAVVDRPASLAQRYPEMADAIAAAGPVPSAAALAKHWAEQAEIEARINDLRTKIAKVKRK